MNYCYLVQGHVAIFNKHNEIEVDIKYFSCVFKSQPKQDKIITIAKGLVSEYDVDRFTFDLDYTTNVVELYD